MSFFQTYRSTQGLDQFPPDQRFCVWRAAHSRLKAKDPIYRARCRRFIVKILVATVVFVPLSNITSWLGKTGVIFPESSMVDYIVGWGTFAVYLPYILIVSSSHGKWLNGKVAEEIKKRPTGDWNAP